VVVVVVVMVAEAVVVTVVTVMGKSRLDGGEHFATGERAWHE
jgi:hypothetical protein